MPKVQKIILSFLFLFLSLNSISFAQLSDESREERERIIEERMQQLKEQQEIKEKPKTAAEVLELLKERAEEKLKKKRLRELIKTKVSAGVTYGHQSNPQGLQNGNEVGDYVLEDNLSIKWVPTFTPRLSADIGYSFYDSNYMQGRSIDSEDHTVNTTLKYSALKSGKLLVEPSIKYERLVYPFDATSSFNQIKFPLRWTYTIDKFWSHGGEFEYSFKEYVKKAARDTAGNNTVSHREDDKNSLELWIKRNIKTYYSVKLKAKSFVTDSNDDYQDYNDYDSHRGYITLAGSFLKNKKLYAAITCDYDWKKYKNRVAVADARRDRTTQHSLYVYYPFNDFLSSSYTFTFKDTSSNAASGESADISNKFGLTISF